MRILHISTRLILGGSQENTVLSCEGQALRGHEVHLAFGPIYGPEGSLLRRVRDFRTTAGGAIFMHSIPRLIRPINPVADALAAHELQRLIRRIKPDIVHTHSSKAGILGRLSAWREGSAGIVHTIHGPPFMPVVGGPLARARIRAGNAIYTVAERFAANRCHAMVSVADAMTREFLARGIGRPEQYTTVRSGMDVDAFLSARPGESRAEARHALGLQDGDYVVGTIARLAEHKGHADLLAAAGAMLAGAPAERKRLVLLWVGDGWLREPLRAQARRQNIVVGELDRPSGPVSAGGARPQLILTGLVEPDRIPGLLRAMDVLAHPSTREGLPRTVPQALLSGVCPVVYACDGAPEVCRDMQTGRLVPPGDIAGLRDAIAWCIGNPEACDAMAARGREECRVAFSVPAMIDGLDRVYARVLGARRVGARLTQP